MVDINIAVNDYGEVYTSSDILGCYGEQNARRLVFDTPRYDGCTFEVRFDVGNESPYSVSVIDGKCVVPASVLITGVVKMQWLALKGTELMAKSKIWEMKVLDSLVEGVTPPTYEQSLSILQQLYGMLPTGGTANNILCKQQGDGNNASWISLGALARKEGFAQTYIINWENSFSNENVAKVITLVKEFAAAQYPKAMMIKVTLGNDRVVDIPLIGMTVSGSLYEMIFIGNVGGSRLSIIAKRLLIDIENDTLTQYNIDDCGYFFDSDKAKLATIEQSAEVNKINTVKVNGTALSVTDKTVDIKTPTKVSEIENDLGYLNSHQSLDNYYTKSEVNSAVSKAISDLVNGEEVEY